MEQTFSSDYLSYDYTATSRSRLATLVLLLSEAQLSQDEVGVFEVVRM
jgi:hypothetical protein